MLHSIVARRVCWRGSASRPPLSRSSRCERRSRICAGGAPSCGQRRARLRGAGCRGAAELGDRPRSARAPSARRRARPPRLGKRRHRVLDLTLDAQQLAARDEQGQVGAGREERRELGRRLDHLLEVVEEEQHLPLADVLGEPVLGAERLRDRLARRARDRAARPARPRRRRPCTRGRAWRRPRSPAASCPCRPGPVSVTGARRPRRARAPQQFASRPTNELAGRGRFVLEIVFSGGKRASPSWKIGTGSRDVLEPVLAEVGQLDPRRARPSRGETTWPPCAAAAMRAREVDVVADVALLGEVRRAGVQTDPHTDRPGGQRLGHRRRGRPPPAPSGRRRRTRRPAYPPRPRRGGAGSRRSRGGDRPAPPRTPRRRARAGASSSPRRP